MPLGLQTAELNFDLQEEIGHEGRNSQVYIAHDKQLDGQIVIKKIPKAQLNHADDYYKESKILYASSHPNVVGVFYGCSDADHIYIAMPHYEKGSLKSLINERFLTVREVLRYGIHFLSGLGNIHSKGLIHFDVKPDNILISDSDEALLSDFGLAKAMDHLGLANPDAIYERQVPPEILTDQDMTFKYDIYLAGLTLYRLINGNDHFLDQIQAFNGDEEEYSAAILAGTFPNRDDYLPHVPRSLKTLINKALSVNIDERHASVLEMTNELGLVKDNLDWQYSINGGIRRWEKNSDDKRFVVTLDSSNQDNWTMITRKTMIASGNEMNVSAHCHTNLGPRKYLSNLRSALRDL